MNRLIRFLFSFLFLLSLSASAQQGDYYLKHFSIDLSHIDNENYAITHDQLGQMRVANRKGLLKFDGLEWKITNTPGTVLSARFDSLDNVTFVGCVNDFGYVITDARGKDLYVSLTAKESDVFEIAKIEVLGEYVYFLGANVLYEYSKNSKKITRTWKNTVVNIFAHNSSLFVCLYDNSIKRIHQGSAMEKHSFTGKPDGDIIFCSSISKTISLIGTSANKIYELKEKTFREISLKDSRYIDKCELTDGVIVDGSTAVLATNKGGCIIADIHTGETKSIVNSYSGLPDDEVYAVGKDAAAGIWIAHEYGLSRLDYHVPFKCYSNYSGLEGKIETATSYNNNIYVATNEGVFMLEIAKYNKEINNKTLKNKTTTSASQPETTTTGSNNSGNTTEPETPVKERFSIRNFFRKRFRNQKDSILVSESTAVIASVQQPLTATTTKPAAVQKKNTEETKQGTASVELVKYVYKKVSGISAKCIQFMIFDNKLLVATNEGIYAINGLSSVRISSDNIKSLYTSKFTSRLFACTASGEVITYDYNGGSWKRLMLFDKIKQPISYISEDYQKNVWLSGISKIYKVEMDSQSKVTRTEEIPIHNPYSDGVYSLNINKQLYFSISSEFYKYDYHKKTLIKDTTFEQRFNGSEKMINSQSDILWIFHHKTWEYISDIVRPNKNLIYLSILRDIEEISTDPNKDVYWVITEDKKLYKFDLRKNYNLYTRPTVFVKDIQSVNGGIYALNNFVINQEHVSSLVLNVMTPDYYDQESMEYQYKIEGVYNNDWSAWSKNNSITVNNLSPGDYTFRIKSRNSIGQEIEKEAVHFTVEPPYWQTWWFYLLEVFFFGCLWIMSLRLNRSNKRIIRKMLTFLTLVITVEFLSTVADSLVNVNISPVMDFLVRVAIAMLLFPIEQFLEGVIKNQRTRNSQKKMQEQAAIASNLSQN